MRRHLPRKTSKGEGGWGQIKLKLFHGKETLGKMIGFCENAVKLLKPKKENITHFELRNRNKLTMKSLNFK